MASDTVRTNGTSGPPVPETSEPRREMLAVAATGRCGVRLCHLVRVVAFVCLAAAVAGCGGGSSSARSAATSAPSPARQTAAQGSPASGPTGDACALLTAADLGSLGVTAAGSPQKVTRGSATVYGCTWGHPPALELHMQFESLDPAAASQVRLSLGGHGTVIPGVGDVARGLFSSVLSAVNFSAGTTFVAMELYGSGAGGLKGTFLAVAKNVASRV